MSELQFDQKDYDKVANYFPLRKDVPPVLKDKKKATAADMVEHSIGDTDPIDPGVTKTAWHKDTFFVPFQSSGQSDIPNIYGTGANLDKFVGSKCPACGRESHGDIPCRYIEIPIPGNPFHPSEDDLPRPDLELERNIYCSVCGRPGRFKVNGKGKMAGRHRACRKPKKSIWRFLPPFFGFGRKGSK